jgi:glycosyltransferase involved in cell wall biosynthesis
VDLVRVYQREQPDLVHHFTIKACLYGTIAAKLAPVYRVINAITGLGHVFLGQRKRTRLLRRGLKPLYRAVFMARRARVVFQNADDQEKLIQLGLTEHSRTRLIRSSGVDIQHFQPEDDTAGRFHPTLQLLFPSRLIREKGLQDKENGRKIHPDASLSKLLALTAADELTYFNLQRYMKHHFIKEAAVSA